MLTKVKEKYTDEFLYDEADNKLHELISAEEQSFIASINDKCENYDVVIERLERAGRDQ